MRISNQSESAQSRGHFLVRLAWTSGFGAIQQKTCPLITTTCFLSILSSVAFHSGRLLRVEATSTRPSASHLYQEDSDSVPNGSCKGMVAKNQRFGKGHGLEYTLTPYHEGYFAHTRTRVWREGIITVFGKMLSSSLCLKAFVSVRLS